MVKFMYVVMYVVRHHAVPSAEMVEFVASMQQVEPVAYIPGNVWRWAEYEV